MKAKGKELIFVQEMTKETESGFKPLSREEKKYLEETDSEFDLVNFEDSKKLFVAKQISNTNNVWIIDHKTKQVFHRDFSRSFTVFIR